MAPHVNGFPNSSARHLPNDPTTLYPRFSDIPPSLEVQFSGGDVEEAVEISLQELYDDPTELCTLLENENAEKRVWMMIALAYAKQKKPDLAMDILHKGLGSLTRRNPKEKIGPLSLLCFLLLAKCRAAPRVQQEGRRGPDSSKPNTKDHWLQAATAILNEAGRINPVFPPLYLARGVHHMLRASLLPPAKPVGPGAVDHSERSESLRNAKTCFEDALKVSGGRNMVAIMGIARIQYSFGRYPEALQGYQEVLSKMPQLQDPDPRIGIGCCLWQLGYKEEARESWERSLELNPESKIATILMGLYFLNHSSSFGSKDPEFATTYKKAMTDFTQRAFKLDKEMPLTCATFGGYFTLRRAWSTVDTLAWKAIEQTDVNAVASDAWYLLARKEHHQDVPNLHNASDFYGRADAARGGGEKGYIPARFGIAQMLVLQGDTDGAKFRLEKIIQTSKSTEAMMLLGALYAEEVFAHDPTNIKEDKSAESKKAIALLEAVRMAWKDTSKKLTPDLSVLVYLARLYEFDQPEKAYQCLLQVETMNVDDMLEKEGLSRDEADNEHIRELRQELSPQLLNNLGCFDYQKEKFESARDLYQAALSACVRFSKKDDTIDTDALVTIISYNLGRTYEAWGQLDEARQLYEGLLARHDDYTDARTRLAYIELRQNPTEDGPKAIAALNETDGSNLEVRALLAWYLSKSKKRATNIAEDQEQKHYKKTLLDFDKHDRYSLTGMGNLYSTYAREMRRSTDREKEKRSAEYLRAVGYFDKVLQLDPKNAYAAQGVGIALVEDKKDMASAVQIFSKARDVIRESSVYINLGHVFCELKQYSRSIENYEAAIKKDRSTDPQVLTCLGRVYLLKGKQDRSAALMRTALEYSQRALSIAPSQIHFKFNIAFVQIQIAQLIYSIPESQRTLADVQAAAKGLEAAINAFTEISQSPHPPYPAHDIEQRANMGRNTMRRQLDRAAQQQKEYEEKNAVRIAQAKKTREAELKKREEDRLKLEEDAAKQRRKIQEEREKMLEVSRELAEKRAEEERRKEEAEMTTDSETGERVRRKKRPRAPAGQGKRKKKAEASVSGSEGSAAEKPKRRRRGGRKGKSGETSAVDTSEPGEKPKKRRRLARKGGEKEGKFKSSEVVVDSDEEDEAAPTPPAKKAKLSNAEKGKKSKAIVSDDDDDEDEDMADAAAATRPAATTNGASATGSDSEHEEEEEEEEENAPTASRPRKKSTRRIEESDDEDEDEDEDEAPPSKLTTAEAADADVEEEDDGDVNAGGKGNAFADTDVSMVDESVGAAGHGAGGGDEAGAMGSKAGEGFGAEEE